MTRLSKYPLTADVWEQITGDFYDLISSLSENNEIKEFFDEFFTATEKVVFVKRFAIALMLSADFSYKDISQILRVSPTTIFFIQHSMSKGKIYYRVIKKITNLRNTQEFIRSLKKTLEMLILPTSALDKKGRARFLNPNFTDFTKLNELERKQKTLVWETTSRTRAHH
ncbi:MAG: Trp family transcriptional regulator [Patescibacteria group bacterium]